MNNRIQTKELLRGLATEAHITKGVICIFFWKNVIRYAFGCFQNIVLYGFKYDLNSTNSIDKVNFNIIITKKKLNYFMKNKQKYFFIKMSFIFKLFEINKL